MSQFGFFNVQQPQPPPARPAYDPYPAAHPSFDAPRRYDDPYMRAPSPPRAGFFGSAGEPRPHPGDRMGQPVYPPAFDHESRAPMNPMVGREPAYYPPAAPQPMAPEYFERRDPYPPSASWRPEQPREERREFFGSFSDTWRSAPRVHDSPPRDRVFNSAAFGSRREISPEARRSFRDDRSPARRDDRARDRPRDDSWTTKDRKDRKSSDEKKSRWDRSGSRDRKKEKEVEKTEKDRKSRDRDSKEPKEEKVRKENGEKKINGDDKKETENSIKKEEENIKQEADEANDDNNDDIKDAEIIEEDEFEEGSNEYEEKEESKSVEEEIDEPMSDESKKSDERDQTEKSDKRDELEKSHKDDRQSRIRSPSIDKHDKKKKKDDSELKILKDATFDEIHGGRRSRPSGRPPFEREREREWERERERNDDYRSSNHESSRPHREADWAVQYKAKVMMTKTAVHGLGGPTGPVAPPPPVMVPAIPPGPPRVPYDAYATAPRHAPAVPYPELIPPPRASAYPPVAPPAMRPPEYARPPLSPPVLSAYGLSVLARLGNNASQGPNWRAQDERDAYDRRRPQDDMRSRSPPPRRDPYPNEPREFSTHRSDYPHRERGGPVEYYTDRYRSDRPERPEERGGRYADSRAVTTPSYESLSGGSNERERRHSHRSPPLPPLQAERRMPPKQKPVVEEIDASKLVEPLEEDGWDDIARMLSPEKVVVEKKAKKPLIAAVPPPHHQQQHRQPMPQMQMQHHRTRDPLSSPPSSHAPTTGGFFSSVVPSVKAKIAFPDSVPFYKRGLEDQHVDFFPAPSAAAVGGAPPPRLAAPAADAYGRAMSYEELTGTNGAPAYRAGPAPGWERGGGRGY